MFDIGQDENIARVLVVGNAQDAPGLYALILRSEGYDVVQAGDAIGALKELLRSPFDVVLLDPSVARSARFALVRQILRLGLASLVRVVMLFPQSEQRKAEQAVRLGSFAHLIKEKLSRKELLTIVREVVRAGINPAGAGKGIRRRLA